MQDQPEFPALALLAARGLLAPDTWKCKRAQVSLKATIDVPMLGTIIEQNGDGLLEDSHMPVGWPNAFSVDDCTVDVFSEKGLPMAQLPVAWADNQGFRRQHD